MVIVATYENEKRVGEEKVRDYRCGARKARKLAKGNVCSTVEWYDKQGTCNFAVFFENGKRESSCFLKE
jgi:hypothetical protein